MMKKSCIFASVLWLMCNICCLAEAAELIVSASAVFTNVFTEIATAFESANPGIVVTGNFAAAGELIQQMAQGAPVDVFASAHPKFMANAASKELIDEKTRLNFAEDALVLITNSKANTPLAAVVELTDAEIERIAIGDLQKVSAGEYAKESFEGYGVWDRIQDKLIFCNSVRQVLDYVRRGEVDAGVVFATDAALAQEHVQVVMPLEHHAPIVYSIAVTTLTKQQDAATRFVEFVVSENGQAILRQFGFARVE